MLNYFFCKSRIKCVCVGACVWGGGGVSSVVYLILELFILLFEELNESFGELLNSELVKVI